MTGTHEVLSVDVSGRERLLIVGAWLVYALVTVANRLFGGRRGPDGVGDGAVLAVGLIEAATWAILTPPIFELVGRQLAPDSTPSRGPDAQGASGSGAGLGDLLRFFGVGIAVAAGMSLLGALLRSEIYPPWPGGFVPPVWFAFTSNAVLYGAVVAAGLARAYSMQSRWVEERRVRIEAELARARLDVLRRQIDPHFLFNTLNLIASLVERDPRGVRRMIARLGELLRASLETGGSQELSLRQELALLNAYLEIMLMRFGDRLTVHVDVDETLLDLPVPGFLLQPLAENAMRHGIEPLSGAGRLAVIGRREGDVLILQVRDNGQPAEPIGMHEGVGLGNTRSRLVRLYGPNATLALRREQNETVAEVRIPIEGRVI